MKIMNIFLKQIDDILSFDRSLFSGPRNLNLLKV